MNGRLWESISSNAKELIKLMLDVDPRCVTICLFVGLSVLPSCFFQILFMFECIITTL